MRRTKIVATLGPQSGSPEVLTRLFEAGVDVFRLNASHGTHEDHAERIRLVRALSAEREVHPAILVDLQGPKIRLGDFEGGGCDLVTGSRFTITTEPVAGTPERASTSYSNFAKDVRPGDDVLLADGSITLKVLRTDGVAAECEVVSGGPIKSRKGINLPGVEVSTPSLTKRDMADLQFALQQGVDMVAMSFVRKPKDVLRLRHFLDEQDAQVPIISKIEKPEGWNNLDAILCESDGVMVARGDLGVELPIEKVPFIQKSIIQRAREQGKFVITATQMLESMVESPFPTRAEVSDVANAIYDGTDAVMLSAETASGKYPVEAVRMMARIAAEAESSLRQMPERARLPGERNTYSEIVADAVDHAARSAGVRAIVVFTSTGYSARLISKYRPSIPVYAFTPRGTTARQLAAVYGVRAVVTEEVDTIDGMIAHVDRVLVERKWVNPGDGVMFVAGQPVGRPGTTNLMKLHRAGQET